jgi:phosphoribosylaminoimidazole-succinocarboxamide synthase
LVKPIFDVSTKLEEADRYVTWKEAKKIAGLTNIELSAVKTILAKVDDTITEITCQAKLENQDGKIELSFDNRRKLMVVDVVGTLDECRFTYDGVHVSKEVVRQFYKKTSWYRDVEDAKKEAGARGVQNWKTLCQSQPPKLEEQLRAIISGMYKAAANELTRRSLFNAPSLAEIIKQYREYMR